MFIYANFLNFILLQIEGYGVLNLYNFEINCPKCFWSKLH